MSKWENVGGPNVVLDGDGFYVSFNAYPCSGVSFWESDNGGTETALVNRKDKHQFRILNGDFRKDYEKIIGSWEKCLEFFNSKKASCESSWSGK